MQQGHQREGDGRRQPHDLVGHTAPDAGDVEELRAAEPGHGRDDGRRGNASRKEAGQYGDGVDGTGGGACHELLGPPACALPFEPTVETVVCLGVSVALKALYAKVDALAPLAFRRLGATPLAHGCRTPPKRRSRRW